MIVVIQMQHFSVHGEKHDGLAIPLRNEWLVTFPACLLSAILINGGILEQARIPVSIGITFFTVTVVQPLGCKWAWNKGSFLHSLGMVDEFGWSGVHIIGGLASLISAAQVTQSCETFDSLFHEQAGSYGWAQISSCIGVFLFLFAKVCWNTFAFSSHAELGLDVDLRAPLNTLIAGTSAAMCSIAWRYSTFRRYKVSEAQNVMVAGAVAASSCCWFVDAWAAIWIGIGAWGLHVESSRLLAALDLEDPQDNFVTHCMGGLWGLVSLGLFAQPDLLTARVGGARLEASGWGLFSGGGTRLLWGQCFSAFLLLEWCGLVYFLLLFLARHLFGVQLSIDKDLRILGLDYVYHEDAVEYGWDEEIHLKRRQYEAARRRAEARCRTAATKRALEDEETLTKYCKSPGFTSAHRRKKKKILSKKKSYRRRGSAVGYELNPDI